jgi:hypothetical protein
VALTTSLNVDLFKASVIRGAVLIILGELDDSAGLAVFLGNFLDDVQLFSVSSLMLKV